MQHWNELSRRWNLVGAPLRPGKQDLKLLADEISAWSAARPPRALILGVTPEFHSLPWPAGSEVRALDRNPQMIEAIWPGDPSLASVGDWRAIPYPDGHFDFVLCDGGMNLLTAPGSLNDVAGGISRVLVPSGRFLSRLFCHFPQKETVGQVVSDLLARKITDVNALKFRLWMALDQGWGTRLSEVWNTVKSVEPDFSVLAARLDWPVESFQTLTPYQNSTDHYEFPGPGDMERLFSGRSRLGLERVSFPTYALGEACPTVVFRKEA